MAYTIGAVTSNKSDSASTLSCTATGTSGDLLIAVCTWANQRSWSSGMSGWTQLGSGDLNIDSGLYSFRSRVYYKIHSGSESNPSFTVNAGTFVGLCVIPITGASVDDLPAGASATTYTQAAVQTPAYTTTENGALAVFVVSGNASSGGWTNSGSATTALLHDGNTEYKAVFVGYKEVATAGSYGAETFMTMSPTDRHYRVGVVIESAATAPTISSVTLSGTSQIGQTLTATVATDQDPVDSTAYQWQKAATNDAEPGTDISGETSSTLALTYADFGDLLDTAAYVRCQAVATKNSLDSSEVASAWQAVTVASGGGSGTSPLKLPCILD